MTSCEKLPSFESNWGSGDREKYQNNVIFIDSKIYFIELIKKLNKFLLFYIKIMNIIIQSRKWQQLLDQLL